MAPTKRVSAALHAELSGYVSTLRALRTNSTLDIVPQLSKPNPSYADSDGEDEISLESEEDADSDHGGVSREPAKETIAPKRGSKGKGKGKAAAKPPRKSRRKGKDNWTRWPLLLGHCPIPEWGFDEEIKVIAEQCHRSRAASHVAEPSGSGAATASAEESLTDDVDVDNDIDLGNLPSSHIRGLTSDAASRLSSLLSLLASHRPNANYTKHSRASPMGWEEVLQVVGVADIFDKCVVEDVTRRMEAIFGPSESHVVHRMQFLEASKTALANAEAAFGEDILSLVGPPPEPKSRRLKRKRKQSASETDEEGEIVVRKDVPDEQSLVDGRVDRAMDADESS